ncbi:MAG TPA: HAMP domain-containing sensor histidine kinase [Thermoanaerobaculia bacterium]|nr:HAMP domain-containing sensor histidine kinase [Thermoanaerobaculia bacterium]
MSRARALSEAKARAEALAEIDRAKTAFFSNVSHELRTPLTLLLGPAEDALRRADTLPADDVERWRLVYRNGLRLLKLVNTLLDFSRIEAGRVEVSYEPTDLAAFTRDLASTFRSAIESAGLRPELGIEDLGEPVFVDRDMWEKIVLNLLSNAVKFTFEGEIEVALRRDGGQAVLTVRDTGTGVSAEQLPLLFDRFHRVPESARAPTRAPGSALRSSSSSSSSTAEPSPPPPSPVRARSSPSRSPSARRICPRSGSRRPGASARPPSARRRSWTRRCAGCRMTGTSGTTAPWCRRSQRRSRESRRHPERTSCSPTTTPTCAST